MLQVQLVPVSNAAVPRLHAQAKFTGLAELRARLEEIPLVHKEHVDAEGKAMPAYRAVVTDGGIPVCIAHADYPLLQHRAFVRMAADGMEVAGVNPTGQFFMEERGLFSLEACFDNPEFQVDVDLGAALPSDPLKLGLKAINTYGDPPANVTCVALAMTQDGTQYRWGKLIHRLKERHVGKVDRRVENYAQAILKELPQISRIVELACQTRFTSRKELVQILFGLNVGQRLAQKALQRLGDEKPTLFEAWQSVSREACHLEVSAQRRDQILEKAALLLDEGEHAQLAVKGQRILEET